MTAKRINVERIELNIEEENNFLKMAQKTQTNEHAIVLTSFLLLSPWYVMLSMKTDVSNLI